MRDESQVGSWQTVGSIRLHEIRHALADDALCELRDRNTSRAAFAHALDRLSTVLAVTLLRDEALRVVTVETPIATTQAKALARPPILVPVLRAGLGMVEAFLRLIPEATVGHIGLWRDEATRRAHRYLVRLPAFSDQDTAILLDPMLATGGSAVSALRVLSDSGAKRLRLACVIAAPEGIAAVAASGLAVDVVVGRVDDGLNGRAFIVPGLGDAGDRQFGVLGEGSAQLDEEGAPRGR